jgi:hypothetical protein
MKNFLKEPLFQFLFAGFLLFVYFDVFKSANYSGDENTILVNKENLLTMMQYRSKAFQGDYFSDKFEALSKKERQQLIDDYVKEEALYREAKKLNLEANDYIIKRRMIQKVDFLYKNTLEEHIVLHPDSLLHYYENNKARYKVPSLYTFTHVFIKTKKGESAKRQQKSVRLLKKLQQGAIGFNQAGKYGERFLYHTNYVDRDKGYIDSHFGAEFSNAIALLNADKKNWKGPFLSEHGYHIVLLTTTKKEIQQPYVAVEADIKEDYKRTFERKLKNDLILEVLKQYTIKIDLQ